jgi:hypothetical protein
MRPQEENTPLIKWCGKCERYLPRGMFRKRKRAPRQNEQFCRGCMREYNRIRMARWRAAQWNARGKGYCGDVLEWGELAR